MSYTCRYCGKPATIRDSAEIYHGRSFGMALICTGYPACDSFVGCHKDTGLPKGSLANAETREWRKRAHAAFDPVWRGPQRKWDRGTAYCWLQNEMSLIPRECHIGLFDRQQCEQVIALVRSLAS